MRRPAGPVPFRRTGPHSAGLLSLLRAAKRSCASGSKSGYCPKNRSAASFACLAVSSALACSASQEASCFSQTRMSPPAVSTAARAASHAASRARPLCKLLQHRVLAALGQLLLLRGAVGAGRFQRGAGVPQRGQLIHDAAVQHILIAVPCGFEGGGRLCRFLAAGGQLIQSFRSALRPGRGGRQADVPLGRGGDARGGRGGGAAGRGVALSG